MIRVFDRHQIIKQRTRAQRVYGGKDPYFLFNLSMTQIEERLSIIRRSFPIALQIGSRAPSIDQEKFGIEYLIRSDCHRSSNTDFVCEEDALPIAPQSLDLIVSALDLHTVNDLPGALIQMRRALKPDGLFLCAILGGETLYELRQCLTEAEIEMSGGMSPRVAPFADKPQMGDLMQRAGFTLPVIDSEIVTVTYESLLPLLYDLRHMGEGNAIAERRKNFTPRRLFLRAAEIYSEKFLEKDGRIRASFEMIYLLGWAPHESQQKPLPRGSAQIRLADFLETTERPTGEKTP